MNGGFSWEKARHSPIYKLQLVNKSPKDAEDINKLTYQKTGPGILEMAKDRRLDCGCGPVQSCDFQSWLVQVQSSPSLFPVLGPDFQTLTTTTMSLKFRPGITTSSPASRDPYCYESQFCTRTL